MHTSPAPGEASPGPSFTLLKPLARLITALIKFAVGIALGLVFLEVILRLNTTLLIAGMDLPSPVSPGLADQSYAVRLSDGDLFSIRPGLVQPVDPAQDQVIDQVRYRTDEFGFSNPPPLPAQVDVAVLGRSYSLGAQSSRPWPSQLAEQSGWQVLNLAQAGGSAPMKKAYFEQFAAPRRPRWVVIEVLVPMDVMGRNNTPPSLIQRLPYPLIFSLRHRAAADAPPAGDAQPVFPVRLTLPSGTLDFVEFVDYLEALSVDNAAIQASHNWSEYVQQLDDLLQTMRRQGACPVLLYAPTKADIYLPLLTTPAELAPVLPVLKPYHLDAHGWLVQETPPEAGVSELQLQANAGQRPALVEALAAQVDAPWIDPSPAMRQAVLAGETPFLRYDTHWSLAGNQIVAQTVAQALQELPCP